MGDFDLSLIIEFRQRPCLYNRNSVEFKDKLYTAQQWQEISNKLGYDVSILKDRMLQLRNRYNLEKRRIEQMREENPQNVINSPWPLFENLQFLSDHIKARRRYKNMLPRDDTLNLWQDPGYDCSALGTDDAALEAAKDDSRFMSGASGGGNSSGGSAPGQPFPNGLLTVKVEENFSDEHASDLETIRSPNHESESNVFAENSNVIEVRQELPAAAKKNYSNNPKQDNNVVVLNMAEIEKNDNDNSQLDELLEMFNLPDVKPFLKKAEINFESLKYLSQDDLKEAIPPIGLRAHFREKLFSWRKCQYDMDEGIDFSLSETIASKVITWLQHNQTNFMTTMTSNANSSPASAGTGTAAVTGATGMGMTKLSKSLKQILQDTIKGKTIKNYFEKNDHLTDSLRGDLIDLILEDTFFYNTVLSPKDFAFIVDEILEIFPNEIREYYFIPRGKRKNPSGKLWGKYFNQKSKRARLSSSASFKELPQEDSMDSLSQDNAEMEIEMESLKLSLANEEKSLPWKDIIDKWQRSYNLRQKELKARIKINEFLKNWPLYGNVRCPELIDIDFDIMHPKKSQNLSNKWNDFVKTIAKYYFLHVKDKNSKDMLINTMDLKNKNSTNYIYAILLNSIILPTARFTNETTNCVSKKMSIPEANESFILHLTTLEGYEHIVSEFRSKHFTNDLTVHPLILVVGSTVYSLEQFYVLFNGTLLKFELFLKCLDVSFKIMRTLNLEYPRGSQGPWFFIQEYFYEISLTNDKKMASICSLLNYLKTQVQV